MQTHYKMRKLSHLASLTRLILPPPRVAGAALRHTNKSTDVRKNLFLDTTSWTPQKYGFGTGPSFFDLPKMLEMAERLAMRVVLISCSLPSWLFSLVPTFWAVKGTERLGGRRRPLCSRGTEPSAHEGGGVGLAPLLLRSFFGSVQNTLRPHINSNDFGSFWHELADSDPNFVAAEICFNDSNFWCIQSSITHNVAVHVHVLRPVCTHTIPFRMLWCP